MQASDFWAIVEDTLGLGAEYQAKRLRRRLEELGPEELRGFNRCLVGLLGFARDHRLWCAAKIVQRGADERSFRRFCGALIFRGEAAFFAALADPETLADEEVVDGESEHLLRLPSEVYRKRFGGTLRPATFRSPSFVEDPQFDDNDDELRDRFPQLWARFRGHPLLEDINALRAGAALLMSPDERRTFRRRARALVFGGPGVVLLVLSLWSWWVAGPAALAALVGAAFLAAHIEDRYLVRAFLRCYLPPSVLSGEVRYAVAYDSPPTKPAWVLPRLEEGLAFIQRQAAEYGHSVRFENLTPEPIVIEGPKLYDRSIEGLDHHAVDAFRAEIDERIPSDAAFVVLITSERRIVPSASPRTRFAPRERAIALCHSDVEPRVYAHEILHLFGARDLYFKKAGPASVAVNAALAHFLSNARRQTGVDVAEHSIMNDAHDPEVRVDPATAVAVGWANRLGGWHIPPLS